MHAIYVHWLHPFFSLCATFGCQCFDDGVLVWFDQYATGHACK